VRCQGLSVGSRATLDSLRQKQQSLVVCVNCTNAAWRRSPGPAECPTGGLLRFPLGAGPQTRAQARVLPNKSPDSDVSRAESATEMKVGMPR
jgi:hypothetical protein